MERLQKVIANAGITSRRKAEQLILEGQVRVNGQIVTELGIKVKASDEIIVGNIMVEKQQKVYYILYKPTGVISSVGDDRGRKSVTDYFADFSDRVYPVGRLDYDTSGLLIMTNDGEFTNLITHPKFKIPKTYIVKIKGIPEKLTLRKLEKGVMIDNKKTAPAKAKLISLDKKKDTSIISLTIHEGRNRQVRKMLEAVGHLVLKLRRESVGNLTLKGLNAGDIRELTPHEVKKLRSLALSGK